MAYLNSANIKVFPCANRDSSYNNDARLLSEHAISNIVNQLISNNAFVITDNYSSSSTFEFNIYGYYFYINNVNNITSAVTATSINKYICVGIKCDISTYAYNLEAITATSVDDGCLDDTDGFHGLKIIATNTKSPTDPDGVDDMHYLCVLEYTNGTYIIPESSKVLFNSSRLGLGYQNALDANLYDSVRTPTDNNATIGLHNVYITLDDGYLS